MSAAPALAWHALANAPAPGTLLARRDALVDGQVLMCQIQGAGAAAQQALFGVLLLRSGDQVHAFANRCAHFGVPLAMRQDQLQYTPFVSLRCNVHHARYRWSDGVCDWGDCVGEALVSIPLDIDADGAIRVGSAR